MVMLNFLVSGPYLDGQVLGAGLEFSGQIFNPGFDPKGQKVRSLILA